MLSVRRMYAPDIAQVDVRAWNSGERPCRTRSANTDCSFDYRSLAFGRLWSVRYVRNMSLYLREITTCVAERRFDSEHMHMADENECDAECS